jgi:hypothetical protein
VAHARPLGLRTVVTRPRAQVSVQKHLCDVESYTRLLHNITHTFVYAAIHNLKRRLPLQCYNARCSDCLRSEPRAAPVNVNVITLLRCV